jgi:hypothetical protein
MTGSTRTLALAVVAALLTGLTACSRTDDPTVSLPTVTKSTATTTAPSPSGNPSVDVRQQAIDAYVGMQRAYLKATETADPNYPELAKYASGRALEVLKTGLKGIQDQGLRGRGEATFRPRVESVEPAGEPTKIGIRDCMDTSRTELYKANGDPYRDEPGGNRLVIATVEMVNGTWKVTGLGVQEAGSCTG